MKRILTILLLTLATSAAAETPRLVVQIVVSSMRAGDLERYAANYTEGGLNRLLSGGIHYTEATYDFRQTLTPTTLTTLSTGAQPSMHGVVGDSWYDYTTKLPVQLTDGIRGEGGYNLIASTLAETLLRQSPESRAITLAMEAQSAITLGGRTGHIYWIDPQLAEWTTSYYYTHTPLPWVASLNREGQNIGYLLPSWKQLLDPKSYRNTRYSDIRIVVDPKRGTTKTGETRITPRSYIERLRYTPGGNSAVLGFAKQAISRLELGRDEHPDLLNICLDASRHLHEIYGPESVEVEDMYYRLDRDWAELFSYLDTEIGADKVVVVLTSDHGTSASYDLAGEDHERFRVMQFRVIANGFLNARYGIGSWVLGYRNGSLYLDHDLIYERNLDLASVQNELSTFALQFSGVSHALSGSALRSTYFGDGYARRMQNSYYPRRSGDVELNLLPGVIEEREGIRSLSGSMYGYDSRVPLIIYGSQFSAQRIDRTIDLTALAPTLARLMGISDPEAAEGKPLTEIID